MTKATQIQCDIRNEVSNVLGFRPDHSDKIDNGRKFAWEVGYGPITFPNRKKKLETLDAATIATIRHTLATKFPNVEIEYKLMGFSNNYNDKFCVLVYDEV